LGKSQQNERDDALRRMLKTPPKPHKPIGRQNKSIEPKPRDNSKGNADRK
jgi:hypothetical protein